MPHQGDSHVLIHYPTTSQGDIAPGPFPVILFGHGMGPGGGNATQGAYPTLLKSVASRGFIVLTPEACVFDCADFRELSKDMIFAAAATAKNRSYHPALASASFAHVGVMGHSEGGGSAAFAAADPGSVNITAAVFMNAWSRTPDIHQAASSIKMPVLWGTGSADPIAKPADTEESFNDSPGKPRVLLVLEGGGHFDPCATGTVFLKYTGSFFDCHVALKQEACDTIYAASGGVCAWDSDTECKTIKQEAYASNKGVVMHV